MKEVSVSGYNKGRLDRDRGAGKSTTKSSGFRNTVVGKSSYEDHRPRTREQEQTCCRVLWVNWQFNMEEEVKEKRIYFGEIVGMWRRLE